MYAEFSLNWPHWADSVIESPCPCVTYLSVCLDVRLRHWVQFFQKPLIGPEVTWPVPGLSLVLPGSPPPPKKKIFFLTPSQKIIFFPSKIFFFGWQKTNKKQKNLPRKKNCEPLKKMSTYKQNKKIGPPLIFFYLVWLLPQIFFWSP